MRLGLRLRPEILTLAGVLIACSVYDESLLVDGDDTLEDSSLSNDTSSSGTISVGSSAGNPSGSPSQGSNTTNTSTASGTGSGTIGGSEASGTGGVASDDSAATANSQGGGNTSSSSGGTGGDSSTSDSTGGTPTTTEGTTGSGATGGSGGTGTAVADPLLIDDLEDGDGKLDPNYSGYWYFAMDTDDPDAGGEITAPEDTDTPRGVTTMPARESSTRAMHAAGTWTGWGAALGFSFSQPDTVPIDGSVFKGISFYARASGTTTVRLEVATEATFDNSNHLWAELSLTSAWGHQEVLWTDLEAPDWDPDAPWEPETMLKVQFHFDNSDFDFWIDDVRFIE